MTEPQLPVWAQPAETERVVSPQPECAVEAVLFSPCTEAVAGAESSDANFMRINLQTSGLAVELQTQVAHSAPLIELNARAELLAVQLSQTQQKLEIAWQRIDFLEAQVQQRDQIIDQLCKQSKE
jgi:hypothetical protein